MTKEKKAFNNGWWSCFSSMSAELAGVSRSELDMVMMGTLQSAGITKTELKNALKSEYFDDRVKDLLKTYVKDWK